MGHPGKRAPTVEICDSDKPYEPLAMRQHALGPYPVDPNLLSQGIPPDDRVTLGDHIFAPVEGTPMPPGAPPLGRPEVAGSVPPLPGPASAPPSSSTETLPSLTEIPPPPPGGDSGAAVPAAPSSFGASASGPGPSVAVAEYNPRTGMYVTPDGQISQQSNLAVGATPKTWKDMLPI
jgi:hypothetical protein